MHIDIVRQQIRILWWEIRIQVLTPRRIHDHSQQIQEEILEELSKLAC